MNYLNFVDTLFFIILTQMVDCLDDALFLNIEGESLCDKRNENIAHSI